MVSICWILFFLSAYPVVHTYILLTADLEDVHAIARQIASSPVAGQLNNIIRRASNLFNQQISGAKLHKRADEHLDESSDGGHRVAESREEDGHRSDAGDRRRNNADVLALGKNATYYLDSIKKIFENV